MLRYVSCLVVLLLASIVVAGDIDFDRVVAPLLSRRCLECHTGEAADAGLDLSTHAGLTKGGESGPVVAPGKLDASLLWKRVAAGEMPEDKPLPADELEVLKQWIAQGAEWGSGTVDRFGATTDSRAGYDWWSLQPLTKSTLPTVKNRAWIRNSIDAFVLAKLEQHDLKPSAEATPSEIVRRVYFDLTGLPPASDIELAQDDPQAYETLVDRLLASPHLGQRWARHWLDVVRYGESHGFEYNQPRNNAWSYRDWVIESLNSDLPYDQFVKQQLAGDVLHPENTDAWRATGFIVAGPHNTTKPSSTKMRMTMRHDELEDIVGAIGQTFLGLTINCARCHDHKFDPITQKEYYQMVATVVGIDHGERELPDEQADAAKAQLTIVRAKLKDLQAKLKEEADCMDEGHLQIVREEVASLTTKENELKAIRGPRIYTAISSKPTKVSRLSRGDVSTPAEPVQPSGLKAINSGVADFQLGDEASDSQRRIKLAEWVAGNQNPVLARVMVNRLWHYHFGQGIVRTPSDFGFNGDRPSHPELLDYLANELIKHDWNLKPIHRLILLSNTYRQSSRPRTEAVEIDAGNRLLWRMNPRRLTAEEIRDSMLRVAGKLDDRHGGVGYRDVREYFYRGSHYYDPIDPVGLDAVRRTVYRFSPRGAKRTILDTFDCPDPSAKTPNRAATITPLQSLSLMNNRFVLQTSEQLADRLRREAEDARIGEAEIEKAEINQAESGEASLAVKLAYRLAYGRLPSQAELSRAERFVQEESLAAFCRVVFNSNEFLYVR